MTISIKPTASGSTIEQDGSTILTVDGSGNLSTPNTFTSTGAITGTGGIYLGGTGSANLLDDYEEGDWTPEIGGTTANPTSISHANDAKYIKIGNMCHLWGFISIQAISGGSGQLQITNLPFVCATWTTSTAVNGSGVVPYWSGMPTGSHYISCWAFRGATEMRFVRSNTAQTSMQNFNITDLDSSCDLRFMLIYPTE